MAIDVTSLLPAQPCYHAVGSAPARGVYALVIAGRSVQAEKRARALPLLTSLTNLIRQHGQHHVVIHHHHLTVVIEHTITVPMLRSFCKQIMCGEIVTIVAGLVGAAPHSP